MPLNIYPINLSFEGNTYHSPIIVRQGDYDSIVFDVHVTSHGQPVNLSGEKIIFECVTPAKTFVRDDGSQYGNMKVIEASQGHFQYTLCNEAFSAVGIVNLAYFALEKTDDDLQNATNRATTRTFTFLVVKNALEGNLDPADYESEIQGMINQLNQIKDELTTLDPNNYALVTDLNALQSTVGTMNTNLTNHINNKSNPHSVSSQQINQIGELAADVKGDSGSYPVGLSEFSTANGNSLGWPFNYATVFTIYNSPARVHQFVFSATNDPQNAWQRNYRDDVGWSRFQLVKLYPRTLIDGTPTYLFDLDLAEVTVNQCIAVDNTYSDSELDGNIYATQAHTEDSGEQSFFITRMGHGGRKIGQMKILHGGHGTSIMVERIGTSVNIWSLLVVPDSSGNKATTYISYFPFQDGKTIDANDSSVTKLYEYPNSDDYASPFGDPQSGYIALRHTITTSGTTTTTTTTLELYKLSEFRAGTKNMIHSFSYTDAMNSEVIQGMALDGTDAYVTFGSSDQPTSLYCIDMMQEKMITHETLRLGKDAGSHQEHDFGETEGLAVLRDPVNSKNRTLLTVITTDATGRRRSKLIGFATNESILHYIGMALDRATLFPLLRPDRKSKRLSDELDAGKITTLDQVTDPGWYYLTSDNTDQFTDFPLKGLGGWWLFVSPWSSDVEVRYQELVRNSSVYPWKLRRIIQTDGETSPWVRSKDMKISMNAYDVPDGVTKLSSFRETGQWYFSAVRADTMTDYPWGSYGAWLINSETDNDGSVVQKLIRNTSTETDVCYRIAKSDDSATTWRQVTLTSLS